MPLWNWTEKLRQRMASRSRRSQFAKSPVQAERCEERCLLSVSALLFTSSSNPALRDLTIVCDGPDDITVTVNNGNVQILVGQNGGAQTPLASQPTVTPAQLARIDIFGSDNTNRINLSNVTTANGFSASLAVNVTAGDSNDNIDASGSDIAMSLSGGNGADVISGGSANDTLSGGDGADVISGGVGNDLLLGGNGADLVMADAGFDTLIGGDGADTLSGGADDDNIQGGNGADNIDGGLGNDVINGDGGNDTITGNDGNDSILGGADDDSLLGGLGDDTINAQAGTDTILGEAGIDSLLGGDGNDSISGGTENDIVSGDAGNDVLAGDVGDDSLFGGAGNDSVEGNDGDDVLLGQGGSDTLVGGSGFDSLDGGSGNDVVAADVSTSPTNLTLSISDSSVVEGNTGTNPATRMTFVVTLSSPTSLPVSFQYVTAAGTADETSDYVLASGTATIPAGQTSVNLSVDIVGDTLPEITETFSVVLSNATNATIADNRGTGTILDNDAGGQSLLSIVPSTTSVVETNSGTTSVAFQAMLTTPSVNPVTFTFATQDGSARLSNNDYVQIAPTVITIPAGQTSVNLPSVVINGDVLAEVNESFSVTISNVSNAVIAAGRGIATITILNDDAGSPAQRIFVSARRDINNDGQVDNAILELNTNNGNVINSFFAPGTVLNVAAPSSNWGMGDGLAYDGSTLYFVSNTDNVLYQIDPDTGTEIPNSRLTLNVGTGAYEGLAVTGGLVFLQDTGREQIFALNPSNGTVVRTLNLPLTLGGNTLMYGLGLTTTTNPDRLVVTYDLNNNPFSFDNGADFLQEVDLQTGAFVGTSFLLQPNVRGDHYKGLGRLNGNFLVAYDPGNANGLNGTALLDQYTTTGNSVPGFNLTFPISSMCATSEAALTSGGGGSGGGGSGGGGGSSGSSSGVICDTLIGGDGDDTLVGSSLADVINGNAGNDSLDAGAGDDQVFGGAGFDTLRGGDGNDTLDGQGGSDLLDGGAGDDILRWGSSTSGTDSITGGAGSDTAEVLMTNAGDTLTIGKSATNQLQLTGNGSIVLDSSVVNVTVNGRGGDDQITITDLTGVPALFLTVDGSTGNDVIDATGISLGSVRMLISGGDGDDLLLGSDSNDTIDGGNGNDVIGGGAGNDNLLGGEGDDTLNGQDGNDTLSGQNGDDNLLGGTGNDSINDGDGNDTLQGQAGDDTLTGTTGDDSLIGLTGNDSLVGGTGLDTLDGGDGNDTLDGGLGNDSLTGGTGNDKLRGSDGDDTLDAGDGDDELVGGDGDDLMLGGAGNDGLSGGDGDDVMNGGAGADVMRGDDGDDTMLGGSGNDTLLGSDGDDLINGQGGSDTVAGNEGVDNLVTDASDSIRESFVLSQALLDRLDGV